ncbi:MAG: asparaginase [Firmicutes bacterium]|nr:asparaginase [Bacillota bacterium]
MSAARPHIHIIGTGGTIATKAAYATQTTGYGRMSEQKNGATELDLLASDLIAGAPGIDEIAEITAETLYNIPSSAVDPCDVLKLARRVNEVLADEGTDGVVITHGTDTLEETAFFLNLTVKSRKPVVVVGSMIPAAALSADGPLNLYNATKVAADPESAGKGVLVCMLGEILSARDATKTSTFRVDSFKTLEYGTLGHIAGPKVRFYYAPVRPHTYQTEFDVSKIEELPKVEILYTYQGCPEDGIKNAVESGCDGIVVAGLGCGAIPPAVRAYYKELEKKPPLVRASRVPSGYLAAHSATPDDAYGTIPAGDFNPQKSRILLQLALTVTKDLDELRAIFQKY